MKTIKTKDYFGKYQSVNVSDEFYEEWKKLENDTQRIYRKEIYHRSCFSMDEAELFGLCGLESTLEDILIQAEDVAALYEAISKLTPPLRRRILMILNGMTLTEVAAQDGCHYNTAQQSFHRALKKLRKYMEKSSKLR